MALEPKQFTPVTSSMVESFHHDPDTRVLTVKYKNGATYQHDDVGVDKVEALTGALSPGKFFNEKIKNNHPGRKVDG